MKLSYGYILLLLQVFEECLYDLDIGAYIVVIALAIGVEIVCIAFIELLPIVPRRLELLLIIAAYLVYPEGKVLLLAKLPQVPVDVFIVIYGLGLDTLAILLHAPAGAAVSDKFFKEGQEFQFFHKYMNHLSNKYDKRCHKFIAYGFTYHQSGFRKEIQNH
jgi:hypothetical protein